MFTLDYEVIAKIRAMRGRKKLTLLEASKEIGISSKTLSLIENEKRLNVKRGVYEKIINWLLIN
ncbi:helix-turn-helix domain-containing protein [Macrococcus brunensis]|uniref:helix-turn-helix domain-containing protein n=1 Tax=Macrococcus brunensis TaxID=198483 RepID=UPI001EF0F8C6|nr:helix-turn-helix transcriptional regulator [Macrococcus brunensis]ULG71181.1 helix-turn-helix domain-containing protein [Macrococcus brunensis]